MSEVPNDQPQQTGEGEQAPLNSYPSSPLYSVSSPMNLSDFDPGFMVVDDFLTEADEERILNELSYDPDFFTSEA